MRTRTSVTVMAMVALLGAPGLRPAVAASETWRLAQAATPLEIPAAPAPAEQAAPQPAPPAGSTPSPAAPAAEPAVPPGTAAPAPAPAPATPGVTAPPAEPPAAAEEDPGDVPADEELSIGEIPVIETIELTPDIAKRALDSYIAARQKYAESDLDQFENLQDFVDQTEDGKAFEADIKAAGFANVTEWNLAITTLGLTYGSIIDDQTSDLLLQIKEVEADTEMAQDIKDRMVKALKALIPSENNKKVVSGMMDDPVYAEKLKLLDIEEE